MKCISSLISPVTLIVYVFFVLFEIFFVLISANCIIAHTAVCTGCFSYKSCMDKLHSGIVGIAHCRHHFRQIMFPCKIRNRTFCKFIIYRFIAIDKLQILKCRQKQIALHLLDFRKRCFFFAHHIITEQSNTIVISAGAVVEILFSA